MPALTKDVIPNFSKSRNNFDSNILTDLGFICYFYLTVLNYLIFVFLPSTLVIRVALVFGLKSANVIVSEVIISCLENRNFTNSRFFLIAEN